MRKLAALFVTIALSLGLYHELRWNLLMLWPVLFANGGSIVLLPWAIWRRKDAALAAAIGAFVGLQALNDLACGIYNENRDWLEIAPLSWILISELVSQSPSSTPQRSATGL